MPLEPHAIIEFYVEPMEDAAASREAGRPIYKDTEMVWIRYVGDPTRDLRARAHEKAFMAPKGDDRGFLSYAERFPDHYAAFQNNRADFSIGTPLEMLPFISASRRAELKAKNVKTAEALAQLNERAIKECGPSTQKEVNLTKSWLDQAVQANEVAKVNAELETLRAEMEAMRAQMNRKPSVDRFDDMDDGELRKFLEGHGITPRANASRDKLLAAARQAAEDIAA